jgi:hypothetical protein
VKTQLTHVPRARRVEVDQVLERVGEVLARVGPARGDPALRGSQ